MDETKNVKEPTRKGLKKSMSKNPTLLSLLRRGHAVKFATGVVFRGMPDSKQIVVKYPFLSKTEEATRESLDRTGLKKAFKWKKSWDKQYRKSTK